MAIIRWNPRSLTSLLDEDWDFPTFPGLSRLGQGLNIYETEEQLIAEAAVPGIPDSNIDVTVEDGVVRISASNTQTQEDQNQKRYFMSTLATSYNYSFRLPENILAEEEPNANVSNGVLTLSFKKAQKQAPKKVKVTAK